MKTAQCNEANAYYFSQEWTITICYELVDRILKAAPGEEGSKGFTRDEVIQGGLTSIVLHELGHAAFDMLKIPDEKLMRNDLAITYGRIGTVLARQGDREAALRSFNDGLTVISGLSYKDELISAVWQNNLGVFFREFADLKMRDGDFSAALDLYRRSLLANERLLKAAPNDPVRRQNVADGFSKIALAFQKLGDEPLALEEYRKGRTIILQLVEMGQINPNVLAQIKWFDARIAELENKSRDAD